MSYTSRLNGDLCFYCGSWVGPTGKDHFPPRSMSLSGVVLPCCRLCNETAGLFFPYDLSARVELVRKKRNIQNWNSYKYLDTLIYSEYVARRCAEVGVRTPRIERLLRVTTRL